MIAPTVHLQLRRTDVQELIAAIGRTDRRAAGEASAALERGDVDTVLDTPAAAEAVRGNGGAPAPVSALLLWYVPVRAELLARHESNIRVADFTATVPLLFMRAKHRSAPFTDAHITDWMRIVESLPRGTTGRAEAASRSAARALWWAGCFPDHLEDRYGSGARRAFLTFAATMLHEAARIIASKASDLSDLYGQVAGEVDLLSDALQAVAVDYLGKDAHTVSGRLERYLSRMRETAA
jgi:hypothetical protein